MLVGLLLVDIEEVVVGNGVSVVSVGVVVDVELVCAVGVVATLVEAEKDTINLQ